MNWCQMSPQQHPGNATCEGIMGMISKGTYYILEESVNKEFHVILAFPAIQKAMDSLSSSFPIRIPFISLVGLIALARVSRRILNRSGERGHPCLVPVFRGNTFSFLPFRMILAMA